MERASWSDIPTGTFAGVGKSAIAPHGPVRASLLPSSLLSNPLRSLRLRGSIQSSIIHIQRVQTLKMERQAREETSVIFGFLGRPYHLGKRDQARVGHVFGNLGGGDVFRPKLGGCAQYVLRGRAGEPCRDWLVSVHLAQWQVSSDSQRFLRRVLGLIVIQIGALLGGHD